MTGNKRTVEGTRARNEQVIADLKAGMTLPALQDKYNLSKSTLGKIANAHGMTIGKRLYQGGRPDQRAERNARIVADIQAGMTMPDLMSKYRLSRPTLYKMAAYYGLVITGVATQQTPAQKAAMKERITMHLASGARVEEIAEALGYSRQYIYMVMKEIRERPQGPAGLAAPVKLTASVPAASRYVTLASKHSRYTCNGVSAGRRYTITEIQPINSIWWVTAQDSNKTWWLIPEDYFNWELPDYEQGSQSPTFTQPAATRQPAQAYATV